MTAAYIIRADARHIPLPDDSVDLIVTSPPYYALRTYTDGGTKYANQIGAENTPAEYVANLIDCTREWMRVLKPGGSLFVNLGDKYAGSDGTKGGTSASTLRGPANGRPRDMRAGTFDGSGGCSRKPVTNVRPKSLIGLPWRYALACIDELGLILRAEIIWSKTNGLPESVTDRVRRSHEQWFHLVQQPRYYSAIDEIREQHVGEYLSSGARNPRYGRPGGLMPCAVRGERDAYFDKVYNGANEQNFTTPLNPLGKLPASVWSIPTQPLKVPEHLGLDHFAAFPMELPRRIIRGWSPPAICISCGHGLRPVVARPGLVANGGDRNPQSRDRSRARNTRDGGSQEWAARTAQPDHITGYACDCTSRTGPTRPAVVLDPFGGTGTTAMVAAAHGRIGISVDRSTDYCRLAQWRVNDPKQQTRAAGQQPPAKQPQRQQEPANGHQPPPWQQTDLFGT